MSFRLSSAMSVSSKPNRSLSTARSLMYGQSIVMPSSRTLRSQPPKTGIQYPKRISPRPSLPLRRAIARRTVRPHAAPAAVPSREGQVPADDRMIEARTQSEQAGLAETGAAHAGTLADTALTGTLAAHAAGARISRAQLESASLGVRGDRVHVLAAHNLNPGDERPHGLHILLEQRDPVDRRRVRGRTNVLGEGLMAVEAAHTEPSATLVVLGYERHGELARCRHEFVMAGDGHRAWHIEAIRAQRGQLVNLAHLQFERPPPVHHPAAVRLQPAQHGTGVILGEQVAAGVR